MVHKFTQSEAGNITVLAYHDNLVIWVDGACYMVTNPETQTPAQSRLVKQIDFEGLKTPDEFKRAIDEYMAKQTK